MNENEQAEYSVHLQSQTMTMIYFDFSKTV